MEGRLAGRFPYSLFSNDTFRTLAYRRSVGREGRRMETEVERKRRLFADIAEKAEQSIAVFTENPVATCVRVSHIVTDEWGVKLRIDRVSEPGLGPLRTAKDCCGLSTSWENLQASSKEWYAAYCAWRLIFDPKFVDAFLSLAARTAAEGKLVDHAAAVNCIRENYSKY
jgi:hypothetical protein